MICHPKDESDTPKLDFPNPDNPTLPDDIQLWKILAITRTYLNRNGFTSKGEILNLTAEELLDKEGIGPARVEEIESYLGKFGHHLRS